MSQAIAQSLSAGRLARLQLLSADQLNRAAELIARVEADGLETVRVVFADPHGILRGKTVVSSALGAVFRDGLNVPGTLLLKDSSNSTVFPVWEGQEAAGVASLGGAADMLLVPDPDTFRVLPWAPHSAWLFCDPYARDGAPLPFAPRPVLRRALSDLSAMGMGLTVGLEVEFHVFEMTDPALEHKDAGMPGRPPKTRLLDQGYQFLSETSYDRMEPVMDMLRRNAQALGLSVRTTEVEMGPSQFEFTFDPADALTHADNMMRFRAMVKETCAREGLHATFMSRPKVDNTAASGWHLHQSLTDAQGTNLFTPMTEGQLTPQASGWIAGLLEHAPACCLLTTPTVNGYKRYQPFQLAPDRIEWGTDNRGAMIRALLSPGDPASRIENRVAEPAANPYFCLAAQVVAGLDGLNAGRHPPAPVETPYDSDGRALPSSLIDAIEAFESSTLFSNALGEDFTSYLSQLKRAEWQRYLSTVSEWEQREYFGIL
ncbi:glutamine synthetase family protein [Thalassovita sp.]|uniref:glutamine synthetase family protein n=1 Tax=Thalassovita sp. TaxID=1979401 RepID=UPI003B5CA390